MSESQSRYSIVERLTSKKLEVMGSKSVLKENLKSKEQQIDKLKKELEIERASQEYHNSKEQMKDKEKVFEEQIKAIEKALLSIEEISKSSPTIQS